MGNITVLLKKFLSNKNTITILGVLLGVVVLYFGYTWRIDQSVKPVSIPYCNQTLIAGTPITDDVIGYTSVPQDSIKTMTNLITNKADIVGNLVSYDSKIPQNGYFYKENLIAPEEMPDSIFSKIEDGNTVFTLEVSDNLDTLGNSIFPNDMIDIYIKGNDDDGKLIYTRFISSIRVLAVKDSQGKNVFADSSNPGQSAYILFSLPEELYLLLSKTDYLGSYDIKLVPRNDSYTISQNETKIENETLEQIILDQTHYFAGECTEASCIVANK